MFSHINIGISEFARALEFYQGLADILGLKQRFADADKSWAGWQPAEAARPLFLIGKPFDGKDATPGNGQMVAFDAASRAMVDRAHAYAVSHGGMDEGAPGLRPHYHADYYGGYFRDPDGNKICIVCHAPPVP